MHIRMIWLINCIANSFYLVLPTSSISRLYFKYIIQILLLSLYSRFGEICRNKKLQDCKNLRYVLNCLHLLFAPISVQSILGISFYSQSMQIVLCISVYLYLCISFYVFCSFHLIICSYVVDGSSMIRFPLIIADSE